MSATAICILVEVVIPALEALSLLSQALLTMLLAKSSDQYTSLVKSSMMPRLGTQRCKKCCTWSLARLGSSNTISRHAQSQWLLLFHWESCYKIIIATRWIAKWLTTELVDFDFNFAPQHLQCDWLPGWLDSSPAGTLTMIGSMICLLHSLSSVCMRGYILSIF